MRKKYEKRKKEKRGREKNKLIRGWSSSERVIRVGQYGSPTQIIFHIRSQQTKEEEGKKRGEEAWGKKMKKREDGQMEREKTEKERKKRG